MGLPPIGGYTRVASLHRVQYISFRQHDPYLGISPHRNLRNQSMSKKQINFADKSDVVVANMQFNG
jgi:hypothetical protein